MENLAKPEVKFGDWIGEGWRMFTSQWKGWVMNTAVYFLACVLPMMSVIIGFYVYILAQTSRMSRSPYPVAPGLPIGFMLGFLVVALFTILVTPFLMGGMHRAALKQLKGGTVEFRDLFSGGDIYLSMLGATFLTIVLTMIGAMICVLPAYIVAGMLFFTSPLIADRKLGAIQAMQTSYELAKRNWLMFTLFAFVVQLLATIGTYACYVGILVTLPLLFTITAVAYRDCFGSEGAGYFSPNAPPAPSDYGQPFQPGYNQPPSAIYGQAGNEPGNYNQPFGYVPPPPVPEAPPPPVNELSVPEAPPPPPDPGLPYPPPPEPPTSGPRPPSTAETLVIESPARPEKITCPSCSASLPKTAAFCPRCGNRIAK